MFLREVIRQDRERSRARYAEIVEAYRNDQGEQEHRVLLSLGPVEALDHEVLRALVRALSRYIGDEPARGDGLVLLDVREFGLAYAVHGLWRRHAISTGLRRLLGRRTGASYVERSVFVLLVHRLVTRADSVGCFRWFSEHAWVPGARRIAEEHVEKACRWLDTHAADVVPVFERAFGGDEGSSSDQALDRVARIMSRFVEQETVRSFDEVRFELGRIRALERKDGGRSVWETTAPSPLARDILERLGINPPPRQLPRPAKQGQRKVI